MFETIRADIARARTENFLKPGFWSQNVWVYLQPNSWIVMTYRFNRWARTIHVPVLRQLLIVLAFVVRRPVEAFTGVFIAPAAQIGPGFVVHNLYGVIVGGTKIGKNCTVFSGTKIGYQVKKIGDDVSIGLGAVIVENVTIGNNVRVAPNSVVITDVPDNTTIMGVPARIRLRRAPLKPVVKTDVVKETGAAAKNGIPAHKGI
jgi:serine O-acetyltransferase